MQTLLYIGATFPESTSTAAGSRTLQLINFFKKEYNIVFASTAQQSDFSDEIENVEFVQIELNNASFDVFLARIEPKMVVFDRFMTEEQFGWRVSEVCPKAIKVLDMQDVHSLRKARHEAFKKGEEFNINTLPKTDVFKREIASVYRCDLSLVISKVEHDLLVNTFNIPKQILQYVPFLVEQIDNFDTKPSFEQREDFVCIGNFLHAPNVEAVKYLKSTLWPLVSDKLPKQKIKIYGAYASQKITQLHNEKEGFLVLGRAENAHKVVTNARVLLAPIKFGAGLKGKLLEAMQNGTPSVTTAVGAEGMCFDGLWNGAIAETAEELAQKAVEIYQNKAIFEQAQVNGKAIINTYFERSKHESILAEKLHDISQNLEVFRTQNVVGSILQHHTLQSTKYLSKWIEAKNQSNS